MAPRAALRLDVSVLWRRHRQAPCRNRRHRSADRRYCRLRETAFDIHCDLRDHDDHAGIGGEQPGGHGPDFVDAFTPKIGCGKIALINLREESPVRVSPDLLDLRLTVNRPRTPWRCSLNQ